MIQPASFLIWTPGTKHLKKQVLPCFRYCAYKSSCTYFDKNTSILEFPIHLHVVSNNYQDYPPLTTQVYAIFTNTEDIAIMASPKYDLTNFLDTILLDMKVCSIYETVWTEMFLINNTAVTQYCGFIELPEVSSDKQFICFIT